MVSKRRPARSHAAALLDLASHTVASGLHRWVLPPSARVDDRPAPPAVSLRGRTARGAREIALASAVVLLLGMGAAGAAPGGAPATVAVTAAVEAPVVEPTSSPVRRQVPAPTEARLLPPELSLPTPAATPPPPVAPAPQAHAPEPADQPAERWLPAGTGMWLHEWHRSEGGSASAVVARAQGLGVSHLYVQTGSSRKGWIGEEVLSQLLPATAGTGIDVIAWDFPKLVDPVADARRMAAAATWSRPGVPRVAAVAPDVETAAEGTHLTAHAVVAYYEELRRALPPEVAVLATVPWPSEKRTSTYPYAETAAHSDAFVPMAYWYNRSPHVVTETSMQWLAQFGLPVMPVGQGYDGRLDAPYLPPDPDPAASIQQFVDAASAHGARSISLWSWQTMYPQAWDVLHAASGRYAER